MTDRVDFDIDQGIAVITINNPPVNALSHAVREGIYKGVQKALDDDSVVGMVIFCEGRTFIAGADISEFGSAPKEPHLSAVLSLLDESTKPVVAAVHGTALGGGLETTLCCNYRVAVAGAKFGLPEVHLGLLPGAGGTQRLPRVVGVEKALSMVTSGAPIGAAEALETGLIDKVVGEDLRGKAVAFAVSKVALDTRHPRVRDNQEKLQSAAANPEVFATVRKMIARKTRGFLAPEYNIRCVEAAVSQPFDDGIITEGKFDSIINCIGILNEFANMNKSLAVFLNSYLPHFLTEATANTDTQVIHMSTDCVFSGLKGSSYIETDRKDGKDTYAKTKGLGEVICNNHLTLRTSVVGPELKEDGSELFNWFLRQSNIISGFTDVYWSGVSTIELAKAVHWAIINDLTGLYHITNNKKISKNDLLRLFRKFTNKDIDIQPISGKNIDKSFLDTRLLINYKIPSYEKMVSDMVELTINNQIYYKYKVKNFERKS